MTKLYTLLSLIKDKRDLRLKSLSDDIIIENYPVFNQSLVITAIKQGVFKYRFNEKACYETEMELLCNSDQLSCIEPDEQGEIEFLMIGEIAYLNSEKESFMKIYSLSPYSQEFYSLDEKRSLIQFKDFFLKQVQAGEQDWVIVTSQLEIRRLNAILGDEQEQKDLVMRYSGPVHFKPASADEKQAQAVVSSIKLIL
ncbi:hypothetical protein Lqui_2936 [Legionella quinlivanii]|uniref:Uncharacterized protein n=1 Tax=Legionella quinlivanii TaxID=45073 RepID=A0A0W0XLE0_9GAMM|nr:hypothetical protein [Legionella quinlivanii]KTD45465.1 hypothetical protein Lqui_2936 [Legionella quinlivanii]SEG33038.1 hypothetical protein SAMN02746093_02550 [Legionella quinlivanii DSM 21216]STY10556.1 Uncharacterised protein [Legionella quinlivanii]